MGTTTVTGTIVLTFSESESTSPFPKTNATGVAFVFGNALRATLGEMLGVSTLYNTYQATRYEKKA